MYQFILSPELLPLSDTGHSKTAQCMGGWDLLTIQPPVEWPSLAWSLWDGIVDSTDVASIVAACDEGVPRGIVSQHCRRREGQRATMQAQIETFPPAKPVDNPATSRMAFSRLESVMREYHVELI